jgi:hypothetical protein
LSDLGVFLGILYRGLGGQELGRLRSQRFTPLPFQVVLLVRGGGQLGLLPGSGCQVRTGRDSEREK